MMNRYALLCLSMLLSLTLGGCAFPGGRDPEALGTASVRVEQPVAPNRPLLLMLTIQNTGRKDLAYLCGGPGPYPSSIEFSAVLALPGQSAKPLNISNGQYTMGSAAVRRIAPGASLEVPLATEPFAAGSYRIRLESTRWTASPATIDVVVPDDPAAGQRFDEALLGQIRAQSLFGAHVAETWPTARVQAALAQDIESSDPVVASCAIRVLRMRRMVLMDGVFQREPVPAAAAPALIRAMQRQTAMLEVDDSLGWELADLAADIGAEDVLGAMIPMVRHMSPGQGRAVALRSVGAFNMPAADAFLHECLRDSDSWTRGSAASILAGRHDKAAVPVLLELNTVPSGRTSDSLYDLSYFPDVPEAVNAIKAALADPRLKDNAQRAWKHMHEVKIP